MRQNKVKNALQRGEVVVGTAIDLFITPKTVPLFANAGLDFLFIDMEHTSINSSILFDTVLVCRACGISPIARVPATEYHLIANTLDMGFDGIIVPRVTSREQAQRIVDYAKFPPMGQRGFGSAAPMDFQIKNLAEAIEFQNSQTLVAVQIETIDAVEKAEEIVSVEGVDMGFVGPADLTISLGIPGQIKAPLFKDSVERVIAACKAHNRLIGIYGNTPEDLAAWLPRGVQFFACDSQGSMISRSAKKNVDDFQAMIEQANIRN